MVQQKAKPITKEERRKAMPYCTERIDWYREVFGELRGLTAKENGLVVEWGKK